ncbi:MAG: EamA family transporter RarD [Proteobacteria bacterium]|nr:EamA family transporter RarD [Pseudomonadota bacterium]
MKAPATSRTAPGLAGGLPYAIGAYTIWGLLPLYLRLVRTVPPVEFVAWRIIWTLPFCLIVAAIMKQGAELRAVLGNRRTLARLTLSATLIGVNWTIYVLAIQAGHFFAASLGYYINPIANVLAGTLFLGERLTARQWTAVALATAGVSLLAWDARDMLWISLSLAASFCLYGVIRKVTPVGALAGLTIESAVLIIPAAAVALWYAASPAGSSFGQSAGSSLLIMFAGVVTGVPLMLFAAAARRMDYSTLGMVQFIAPTMVFVMGLTLFHEPLRPVQLACFMAIWVAIAVFVWDLLAQGSTARATVADAEI